MKLKYQATALALSLSLAAASANAALESRLGGQAVYDTDLNVTWLTNANLAATNTFGLATGVNLDPTFNTLNFIYNDGSMTWDGAKTWIATMNTNKYLGYSDWRLPTTPASTDGYLTVFGGEMNHLFSNELGGSLYSGIAAIHNANYNLFQNIQENWSIPGVVPSGGYWTSSLVLPTDPEDPQAMAFYFQNGMHLNATIYNGGNAMVVRTGDIAAVPVPAAAWLLGSGLLGLVGVARRKAA